MSRIGKLIGGALYLHRDYQNEVPAAVLGAAQLRAVGFPYDVVKWDRASNNVTFVQCPGFNSEPEPVMGAALMVRPDGSTRFIKPATDPWVYHHKYAFVGPDYRGFNVAEAKRRQAAIDMIPGVDKSRIGKFSVNKRVTQSLGAVPKRTGKKPAGSTERNRVDLTSQNQLPAIFNWIDWQPLTRNADIGGGAWEKGTEHCRERQVQNLVYDPYCRPDDYEHVGSLLLHHPADTGTCANVLNVIEYAENRLAVLRDLARFVKPGGAVYIGIYEKNKDGVGANTSSGSWQNNWKTDAYLDEVRAVFPDARKKKAEFIIATNRGPYTPGGELGALERFNPNRLNSYKAIQNADRAAMRKAGYTDPEAWAQRDDLDDDLEPNISWMLPYANRGKIKGSGIRTWPAYEYLNQEYSSYRSAYLINGELNLTAIAEHLQNVYEGMSDDAASELAFAWAEDIRPVGYEHIPLTKGNGEQGFDSPRMYPKPAPPALTPEQARFTWLYAIGDRIQTPTNGPGVIDSYADPMLWPEWFMSAKPDPVYYVLLDKPLPKKGIMKGSPDAVVQSQMRLVSRGPNPLPNAPDTDKAKAKAKFKFAALAQAAFEESKN